MTFDAVPPRYNLVVERESLELWTPGTAATLADVDGVLILDTCTYNQLEPAAAWLRTTTAPKVAFDHHATRDDLANEYLIDVTASAACLLLWEWARAVGWTTDAEAARAVFVGIATDTGWFRYSNTDSRTLRAASELIDAGVKPHELYQRIYQCDTASRVRLFGAVLHRMELHALSRGGALVLLTIPRSTFAETGATPAETEDLVSEPLRMAEAVASVLLVDQGDGVIRVNLRSKAIPPGSNLPDLDVAAIAAGLGGGGHVRAAGAKMKGDLEAIRKMVLARFALHVGGKE